MAKVKISELPSLSPATLDTTYVVGISGSTTYKISINQLTSSLDTTFATDLVTAALSSSLNSKLSTSSYSTDSASFNSRIISGSAAEGTISGSSQISDLGFVTGSYTTINSFNSLTQSFNSISQSFSVISGSVGTIDFSTLATTGSNTFKGNQIVSGSVGISANTGSWNFRTDGTLVLPNNTGIYGNGLLQIDTIGGFLLTSYTDQFGSGSQEWYFHSNGILNVPGNIEGASNLTTTASFNTFTQSYYSASASFDERIIAATNEQDLSYLATTGSNTFIGNQTITGSLNISGGLDVKNNGYSWSFDSAGRTKIPNITFNSDRGNGMVGIKPAIGREFQIETSTADSSVGPWSFGLDGTLTAPVGANIIRVGNLVTTSSFNTFTHSIDSRVDSLENATSSYLTSLNGAISSSTQVLNGSGIFSSSAQLPTGLISSSTQLPSNLISGSSQISTLGFITGSYISSSTYTTDSSSFNSRIISGSAVAGTISGSAQISTLGFVSSSNLSSIRTITSASYAALTPVSGTLYIIIG